MVRYEFLDCIIKIIVTKRVITCTEIGKFKDFYISMFTPVIFVYRMKNKV